MHCAVFDMYASTIVTQRYVNRAYVQIVLYTLKFPISRPLKLDLLTANDTIDTHKEGKLFSPLWGR